MTHMPCFTTIGSPCTVVLNPAPFVAVTCAAQQLTSDHQKQDRGGAVWRAPPRPAPAHLCKVHDAILQRLRHPQLHLGNRTNQQRVCHGNLFHGAIVAGGHLKKHSTNKPTGEVSGSHHLMQSTRGHALLCQMCKCACCQVPRAGPAIPVVHEFQPARSNMQI